jgi:DNA modification methylase
VYEDADMNERSSAYQKFLLDKVQATGQTGFSVNAEEMHPSLMPHQRDMVRWAAQRGKALIAASFGLGKTRLQIELLRHAHQHTGRPVLVVCPLGVKHQFVTEDGAAMGVTFVYVRNDAEVLAADTPYLITNYERVRDGNIGAETLGRLGAVTLDEGAILGNLGTKTQDQFNMLLAEIPYRWVATATPAPNDYRQMIYFADFLDVMDAGQALTRFFGRNPDKAGDLQLMPHMEKDFWLWVASWALFVDKPSDLGYDDTGYVMPELEIHWHRIAADHAKAWEMTDQNGQRFLLKDTAAGVTQAMKEKRDSLAARIQQALAIVDREPTAQMVIWCNLNDEQSALERGLKARGVTYASVHGSLEPEEQEARLYTWKHQEARVLVAKPSMLGSGVNLQQAHIAIYAGLDFKFRDFIQSVHRLQRYGQTHTVQLHGIHTDAEDHVVDILLGKWRQHDAMVARMRAIVQEYGLTNEALVSEMRRALGVTRQERRGLYWTAINNDCVLETMQMPDNSVDEIVTSIPFGNHYEYVASLNDFGHNPSDSDFWQQMDFLIPELLRVLKPGRMACIHAKDRLLYGHQTPHGMMEVDYFTHDCARAFRKHGFVAYGEIFIPTDVVRENNSTNRLGWTENCKDSSKMGVGLSEKVLLFRKPQTDKSRSCADEPVRKDKKAYSRGRWQIDAHSLWRSNGLALQTPADNPDLLQSMDGSQVFNWYRDWSKANPYDYHQHVAFNEAMGERLPAKFMLMPPQAPEGYEESVWTDVLFFRTLNLSQARRRVEKHICPFPLDIVERLIVRYSNPDDLVFDPFSGIGTTAYMAIKLGRRAVGTELNGTYFDAFAHHCREAETERQAPTLFALDPVPPNGNQQTHA